MTFQQKRLAWLIALPFFPLILPQALWVRHTTLRLPEAQGQTEVNHPGKLRLLHVGESTVAGVGVETVEQGLTHHLSHELPKSLNLDGQLSYSIYGSNGIRLHELLEQLRQYKPPQGNDKPFDMAIITMGVNDCSKLTSLAKWQQGLEGIIELISRFTKGPIFFTQVPPMGSFPALPFPIKSLLGLRSQLLDHVQQKVCDHYDNVYHLNIDIPLEKEMMAVDGYHPGALGYKTWATLMAAEISRILEMQGTGTRGFLDKVAI